MGHADRITAALRRDAITGNTLRVAEQLIYIGTDAGSGAAGKGISGVQREGWKDARTVTALADLLAAPSPARSQGTHEAQGVLIRADPGTGKTWSMQQLAHTICDTLLGSEQAGVMLVPLLVPVQQLAKHLAEPNALLGWVDSHFTGEKRSALHLAYGMRALVVLLDGVDEAAGKRKEVETLVLRTLVRMGQRVVVRGEK